MPMNPLPPTGGAGAASAAPAGPGRKEEPGTPDSAFTALLMALMGAQVALPVPLTDSESPGPEQPQENLAPVPVATGDPAVAAPTLPEAVESLLQANRVAVPGTEAPPVAPKAPEGTWQVEPLPATAIRVQAHELTAQDAMGQPSGEAPKKQTAAPLPDAAPSLDPTAGVTAFALQAGAIHRPDAASQTGLVHKALPPIPSPIDPDRLIDAVAKAAVSADDGRYTVTLRLHPEQLGEVRLQLHVVGREVQTSLQVNNPAAQQLLEQRGDQLRDSLNQNGLTLTGFHVATGQQEGQRDAREALEQMASRQRGRRRTDALAPIGTPSPAPLRTTNSRRLGGLDTLA